MSAYIWPRTENFFLPFLQRSYILAKAIINAVDIKLHSGIADAGILAMYTEFHVLNDEFDADYGIYSSLKSINPSNTQGVTDLLGELMSRYAKKWDVAVQHIYEDTTTKYKSLFPNRRKPFQKGSLPSRITALNNLVTAIGSDATLATVKTEVETFLALLKVATDTQGDKNAAIAASQTVLDAIIVTVSVGLMKVYGLLTAKYCASLKTVDNYFPVDLLHVASQWSFTLTLDDLVPQLITKRKFDILVDKLNFINNGTSAAKAYFTNGIATTPEVGVPIATLAAESNSLFNPVALGYTDAKRYLYVVSTDGTTAVIVINLV